MTLESSEQSYPLSYRIRLVLKREKIVDIFYFMYYKMS